ncbi:MAG TPA: dephospho-CoA kinase, partial [Tepidisphaeraceae bacterium]|nr:dephospho-CoA kinase [Tepidisphaeraceae bacterium]
MFSGKPIIGIVGGIGSGKSFIARIFGEFGCRVIDSDAQVREAYRDPHVRETLASWWGPEVMKGGEV